DLELARVGERGGATRAAGRRHRRPVDADRIVDAADDEVARSRSSQGGPDRGQLVEELLRFEGASTGPRPAPDALADLARRLARRAPSEVLVLAHDDLVERRRGRGVVPAPVVGAAVDRD